MQLFLKINWLLTIALSLSTGVFKLVRQEADIELFIAIGFNENMTFTLGIIQVLGGLLIIPNKTRKLGVLILIPSFILASTAVFANNRIVFGIVSLLFIAMTFLVLKMDSARLSKNIKNE